MTQPNVSHPMTDHQLETLAESHAFQAHIRDEAQEIMDQLKIEIGTEMAIRGVERVDLKAYTTLIVQSVRRVLNPTKLLEAGVPQDVINACTEESLVMSTRVNPRRVGEEPATAVGGKPKKSHHKKKPVPPVSLDPLADVLKASLDAQHDIATSQLPDPQAPEPELGEG